MDVVISGSHGLIGSALVRSLQADGHRAIRLVRSEPAPNELAVRWDPGAGEIDRAGLEGVDAVVHLAGEGIASKRWTAEHKRRVLESRTKGTTLLAEALGGLAAKPAVLLSGSAIGYYGDRGDERLTEASSPGDLFLSEVCTAWEASTAAAGGAGIRVAHLRTGIVLAEGGGALAKQLPLFKLGLGGKLGSGEQYQSWVSIDDHVGAMRFLLDHDVAGPVNLTGPEPVTNAAFTKAIGTVLGRPTLLTVPSFGPKLLLGTDLADELLFASQRVLPDVLTEAGYRFRHADVETALRAVLGRPDELAG
ncbi:TIGR01777 family oxidoreductase [soil metagenome]